MSWLESVVHTAGEPALASRCVRAGGSVHGGRRAQAPMQPRRRHDGPAGTQAPHQGRCRSGQPRAAPAGPTGLPLRPCAPLPCLAHAGEWYSAVNGPDKLPDWEAFEQDAIFPSKARPAGALFAWFPAPLCQQGSSGPARGCSGAHWGGSTCTAHSARCSRRRAHAKQRVPPPLPLPPPWQVKSFYLNDLGPLPSGAQAALLDFLQTPGATAYFQLMGVRAAAWREGRAAAWPEGEPPTWPGRQALHSQEWRLATRLPQGSCARAGRTLGGRQFPTRPFTPAVCCACCRRVRPASRRPSRPPTPGWRQPSRWACQRVQVLAHLSRALVAASAAAPEWMHMRSPPRPRR